MVASDVRLFQPITQETFVDEVYEKKPPKVVNGYFFGGVLGEGSYSEGEGGDRDPDSPATVHQDHQGQTPPQDPERAAERRARDPHPRADRQPERRQAVRALPSGREKEKLYLVMEFCVCSLQQLLDQTELHRLPEFQCHGYFVQLMDGVDYLHSVGCIHKDIKPGNLLLSSDSCLKICDFGVAEMLDVSDPLVNDWCTVSQGTPKFQPPEEVSGTAKRFRGRPVDVWACGVTLFNMISGEYPFEGENLMKLFENVTHSPVTWPRSVQLSDDLHKLLANTLEKDPERRWNSTAIRASAWHNSNFDLILDQLVPLPDFTWRGADPTLLGDEAAAAFGGEPRICPWRRRRNRRT
ncbi:Non-specific serine/threonine protein kinase [Aphelenchoides fujianensis]|nr:Non-specific serine/threonine protein kinase [Aphelenchoides fujianensis]